MSPPLRRVSSYGSLIRDDGELELSLVAVEVPSPQADEVVVRVEASPINPSDLGLMVAVADMSTAQQIGTPAAPVVTARIPQERVSAVANRVGQSMTVGNEGSDRGPPLPGRRFRP